LLLGRLREGHPADRPIEVPVNTWTRIAVRVAEVAIGAGDVQLIGVAREVTPFEAGAGDKAVAAAADGRPVQR
jgi:hypothetical protein